jgi:hypothetical protein
MGPSQSPFRTYAFRPSVFVGIVALLSTNVVSENSTERRLSGRDIVKELLGNRIVARSNGSNKLALDLPSLLKYRHSYNEHSQARTGDLNTHIVLQRGISGTLGSIIVQGSVMFFRHVQSIYIPYQCLFVDLEVP